MSATLAKPELEMTPHAYTPAIRRFRINKTESPAPLVPETVPALTTAGDRLPAHALPPQPTRLIDRQEELPRLGRLLT